MEVLMTTFQTVIITLTLPLVFSSSTMAWTWEEVKQEIEASGQKLESSVKQAGEKLEQGVKQSLDGLEKGIDKLEHGVKQSLNGVEKGIQNFQTKIPQWVQNMENGFQKGKAQIGDLLRQLDNKIDRSGKGCGSGLSTQIIKDNWLLFDFTSACEAHDQCYEQCNRHRKTCDNDFFTHLQQACPTQQEKPVQYHMCQEIAKLYWYTVSKTGESAWKKAQTTCR
jgi:TolA-binding protein